MTPPPTSAVRRAAEREASRTIKLVLTHMEELASLPPEDATDPYALDARRQQVIRSIWQVCKLWRRAAETEAAEAAEAPC